MFHIHARAQRQAIVRGFALALLKQTAVADLPAVIFPVFTGTWLSDVTVAIDLSGYPSRSIPLEPLSLESSLRIMQHFNMLRAEVERFPVDFVMQFNAHAPPHRWTPFQLQLAQLCALLGHTPRLLERLVDTLCECREQFNAPGVLDHPALFFSTVLDEFIASFQGPENEESPFLDGLATDEHSDLVLLHWSGVAVSSGVLVRTVRSAGVFALRPPRITDVPF